MNPAANRRTSAGPTRSAKAGRRVLIVGCGDLGLRVAALHRTRGDAVYALRRTPGQVAPYTPVIADLTGHGPLDLPPALDLVYFTVAPAPAGGAAATPGPDRASPDIAGAYEAVYRHGLARVLAALAANPPKRLLLVTSTRPYAQSDGGWVHETSPATAWDARAASLLAAEAALRDSGIPGVALRLAGLYGAGAGALLRRVRAGSSCPMTPPQWTNRVHRDDAARALVHIAQLPTPAPRYLVCDDAPAPQWEVLAWLARRVGAAPPQAAEVTDPGAPNRRCSNALLRGTGWAPVYPDYRAGYRALIPPG